MYKKDIRLMAFVASAMFWGSGFAADNSIYIDQSGDNSTITMTQDGAGNKVKGILINGTAGGTTDPAKLSGNAQTVAVQQIGANNTLSLGVTSTQGGSVTGYSNIGVNLNYVVTGGSNTGYININNNGTGTAAGNVVNIQQTGSSNTTNLTMTGTSNQLSLTTSGGNTNAFNGTIAADDTVTSVTHSGGGGNSTTLNMTGNKGQVSIATVGASNTTSITQSAYGSSGAQVIVDINGTGNTTTVNQSGGFDHYANIKLNSNSNSNTILVDQSGGSGTGHSATLELVAGSSLNNVSITQQGSISNLSNIKLSGNNNTYTILQKN